MRQGCHLRMELTLANGLSVSTDMNREWFGLDPQRS